MSNKRLKDYTKSEIDSIKDCAPVTGTLYNQKCNKCGNILSADDYQCDRCGSYDIVDNDDFEVIAP